MPFQEALDDVLEQCSRQPFQKASYWLLQKACILSNLSQRVYSDQSDAIPKPSGVELTRLPQAAKQAPAISLDNSPASTPSATLLLRPGETSPVHATWVVKDLGVVVAFRGTANLEDAVADISFDPVQLASSKIWLHGAIHTAAVDSIPAIQAAYAKAVQSSNQQLPLFLTGHYNCMLDSVCFLTSYQCCNGQAF